MGGHLAKGSGAPSALALMVGGILLAIGAIVSPPIGFGNPTVNVDPSGIPISDPETENNPYHDPVSEAGQRAQGLYLGANFVERMGLEGVIRTVRGARLNAVVIDLKDSEGRVHHDTRIPELENSNTGWLGDAGALVQGLHDANIYTVARIVCFADRRLPARMMDRAIQDARPRRNEPWVSWGTGGTWLDPYNTANHEMIIGLAVEAENLGFDEIQLDYVRFPVDDGIRYAHYPSASERPRSEVILQLLRGVDEAVRIPLSVDVFGLAAYRRGDPSGLGQDLEAWTDHVEIFTPMLYINSMRNWRRGEVDRTFLLVFTGSLRLRRRVGRQPIIRPFLQAFAQGAGEPFGPDFIFNQVRGARRGLADGFLFWHPGHTYSVVGQAMRGPLQGLMPFPLGAARIAAREREGDHHFANVRNILDAPLEADSECTPAISHVISSSVDE